MDLVASIRYIFCNVQSFVLAVAVACAPPPKDLQAASVRYAEGVDDIAHGSASVGLDKLRATVRRYPWFAVAHLTVAQTEDKRGAWLNAYVAYRRYLVADIHTDDRAPIEQAIDALVQKSKPLATFAEGE